MRGTHRKLAVLVAVAALVFAACGGGGDHAAPAATTTPHGYVEGAQETAEAQSRLVLADAGTGAVRVLDLLTEEVTRLATGAGVERVSTDGRFAYLVAGGTTHVIDSGSWRVDHGDHVHYYRAAIGKAGTLGGRAVTAHAGSRVTTVVLDDDRTVTLAGPDLEAGRVEPGDPIDGLAVPYEGHLVVATGDGVSVRTPDGERVGEVDPRCPDPAGTALTGRGVVFGCADGALLVSEDDGSFDAESIPYPRAVPATERARAFTGRPGSAMLTAPAGDRGVWSLDVSQRAWTLAETGPVVAVNAVGEGGPLLTLTADGTLHAYDAATGERTASTPLLDGVLPRGASPVIRVDPSRAYVNDPAGRRVHEVDYHDELRVARTFDVDITPSHVVETGR